MVGTMIHVPHGRIDRSRPSRARPCAELRNDQRHSQRRLVGEDPVRQLAVVAEALAVVGGDDHERLAREAREPIEQRTERAIGPGDFAGIRIVGERGGRTRPAAGRARADRTRAPRRTTCPNGAGPGERGRYNRVGAPLRQREVDGAAGLADAVVVDVEAGVQAETLIERETRRRRRRSRSRGASAASRAWWSQAHPIAVVVADAVLGADRRRSAGWYATAA